MNTSIGRSVRYPGVAPDSSTIIRVSKSKTSQSTGLFLLHSALLIVLVLQFDYIVNEEYRREFVFFLALSSSVLSASIISLRRDLSLFGFVGVYFLYTALSHLGIVISSLIVANPFAAYNYNSSTINWFYSDVTPYAIALAGIGISTLTFSASIVSKIVRRSHNQRAPRLGEVGDRGLYRLGMLLLSGAAVYILAATFFGAITAFQAYRDYRAGAIEAPGYAYFLFSLATGIAFVMATGNKREILWGLGLFLIPSLILVLSGNRGEVLYPIAASLAVLSKRGFKPRMSLVLIALAIFFVLIPFISHTRQVGVQNLASTNVSMQLTDSLTELGFQLRPVHKTAEWIKDGQELAWGKTYYVPVLRVVMAVFPLADRPTLEGTPFYVKERLGGWGYSVIAESYLNFGPIGVFFIPALIGLLLVFLGEKSTNSTTLAFAGAVMVILIINVRNNFMFVPGQVAYTIILFLFSRWLILRGRK